MCVRCVCFRCKGILVWCMHYPRMCVSGACVLDAKAYWSGVCILDAKAYWSGVCII